MWLEGKFVPLQMWNVSAQQCQEKKKVSQGVFASDDVVMAENKAL